MVYALKKDTLNFIHLKNNPAICKHCHMFRKDP